MDVPPTSKLNFEAYLESWKGQGADIDALQKMNINPNTIIDISFASFDYSSTSGGPLPGLQFGDRPEKNAAALKAVVDYIHSKGGQVKLSFGGATYALGPYLKSIGPDKLAADIKDTVKTFGLDGVDLDIEDGQSTTSGVVQFIQILRTDLDSSKTITLTVPGQDWTAKDWIVAASQYVDSVNFMEYDIWVPGGGTEVSQIEQDINTYINDWGIPAGKIHLGLMPGPDDQGRTLSIADAQALAQFAISKNLGGVMIWDLNRDFTGAGGQGSLAYTTAIEQILWGSKTR